MRAVEVAALPQAGAISVRSGRGTLGRLRRRRAEHKDLGRRRPALRADLRLRQGHSCAEVARQMWLRGRVPPSFVLSHSSATIDRLASFFNRFPLSPPLSLSLHVWNSSRPCAAGADPPTQEGTATGHSPSPCQEAPPGGGSAGRRPRPPARASTSSSVV